ncbi:MAG: 3-hydroxyisobutyrate dehydrogenase [Burkholderiaceae bacterium]|nr:3-hydroxyisobutyrate dehydrogenase [Burkholderiaceae bacterium]
MTASRIAFIGLGNMGGPMAANLQRAGYRVIGFDVAAERMTEAAKAGIEAADSAAAAAREADVVVTMLPAAPYVATAWDEIVPAARPGTLLMDSSTCDVATTRALHEKAAAAGLRSLDAPVSGGTGGAQAGTLTFMVGGSAEAFAAAEPLLAKMGRKAVHCGDGGAGQAAKICNNMILGVSIIAVSEAFVLGEKLGLSAKALFDVASTSTGQCWALNTYCPVPGLVPTSPANNDYRPGAPATMLLKDLRLAMQAAQEAGASPALGEHATGIFERFVDDGHGGEDFSAIIRALRA